MPRANTNSPASPTFIPPTTDRLTFLSEALPLLRPLQSGPRREEQQSRKPTFFFRLRTDERGEGFLEVVDAKGDRLEKLPRQASEAEGQVLRLVEQIRQQQMYQFSWDEADDIPLREHAYLLPPLMGCTNLVNERRQTITADAAPASLHLYLTKEGDVYHPTLVARTEMETGHRELSFRALSPDYVLRDDRRLLAVPTMGGNYGQLSFFTSSLPARLAEQWLSVFFSYVSGFQLHFPNRETQWISEPLRAVPTLIFEKVDSDMALYLRLRQTVDGFETQLAEGFHLTCLASLKTEGRVTLRTVERIDEEEWQEKLLAIIARHAPSKRAAREMQTEEGDLFILPQETASEFLLKELAEVARDFRLMGSEHLGDYKIAAPRPKLNVRLGGSGIDFLEGDATVSLGDETLSLADFLKQYQKNRYVELSSGDRAIVDEAYVRRLERIFRRSEKDGRLRVSFFDLPEIEALLNERFEGEAFAHHRQFYEGFNALPAKTLRIRGINATLRPYQREGVKWLEYLYAHKFGACLADDMGLGKTLQTITLLSRIYPSEKKPTLIVMPRSLLFNWQDELRKFAPQLTFEVYYSPNRQLETALKAQLVLTTYAVVRNDIDLLRKRKFHMIVLDESQNIKNLDSQVSQAVCLLQAPHRLALSGTPIENNLGELYSLFRFLNPAMFGSADDFNRRYATPIQRDSDEEATEALRRRIFPFILRRLKTDVLKDLPPRLDQTLYVEMDAAQARFYEERRAFYRQAIEGSLATQGLERSQFLLFQALSELRRIASVPESLTEGDIASPKLERLMECLQEAVAGGHKVVVFYNFIAGLELTGERLNALGIDFVSMTGSTRDRRSIVARFQEDASCRVLLMTLKTGGVGLNLTSADTVFLFEPWWNRAAEEQAINRLHRIGQGATMTSYALITHDTIEEKIQQLQAQKTALTDALISSDSMSKKLTEDDIRFILG